MINSYKDFIPLGSIFLLIIIFTLARQFYNGFDWTAAMYDFMAGFFIIFSLFKIANLKGFAEAYSMYDIIAKRFFIYGYIYPFIELGLGIAYLTRWQPLITNGITIIVMLTSSIGVAQELMNKRAIHCACLGVLFKIPMTYVTLFEDLLMAGMAAIMFALQLATLSR